MRTDAPKGITQDVWDEITTSRAPVIVTVHGTFAATDGNDGERWWQRGSAFTDRLKAAGGGDTSRPPLVVPFHWSGSNSDYDREQAAAHLHGVMARLSAARIPYAIIGHSHGGNVVYYALRYFSSRLRFWKAPMLPKAIVTVGTPFFVRRRTLVNVATTMIYTGAFLTSLPILGLLLIVLPSFFGVFGGSTNDQFQGISTEYVLLLLLALTCATLWLSWTFGVSRALGRLNFFACRAELSRRWLCIHSNFDEAISSLSNLVVTNYQFVSKKSARRSTFQILKYIFTTITIVLFLIGIYSGLNYANYNKVAYSQHSFLYRNFVQMIYFIIAANLNLLLEMIAAFLAGLGWYIYWLFSNRLTRSILSNSAFGQDSGYNIYGVKRTPEHLECRQFASSDANIGGITEEARQKVVAALFEMVLYNQGIQSFAADPMAELDKLSAILFHNAYFSDDTIGDVAAKTIAEALS